MVLRLLLLETEPMCPLQDAIKYFLRREVRKRNRALPRHVATMVPMDITMIDSRTSDKRTREADTTRADPVLAATILAKDALAEAAHSSTVPTRPRLLAARNGKTTNPPTLAMTVSVAETADDAPKSALMDSCLATLASRKNSSKTTPTPVSTSISIRYAFLSLLSPVCMPSCFEFHPSCASRSTFCNRLFASRFVLLECAFSTPLALYRIHIHTRYNHPATQWQ